MRKKWQREVITKELVYWREAIDSKQHKCDHIQEWIVTRIQVIIFGVAESREGRE